MKTLLISLFFSTSVFALNTSDPKASDPKASDMCENHFCTEAMKKIYNEYISLTSSLPAGSQAYSGECYYVHPNVGPDRTHHGVILLESPTPDVLPTTFSGLFSYFTNENPYKGLPFEEVKKKVRQGTSNPKVLKNLEEESRVVITPEGAPIYYWIKFTSSKALLMSKWTFENNPVDYRIFCDLNVKVTE